MLNQMSVSYSAMLPSSKVYNEAVNRNPITVPLTSLAILLSAYSSLFKCMHPINLSIVYKEGNRA